MTSRLPKRRLHAVAVLLAVLAACAGCGRPTPQVVRGNLRYAQALRTAANSRDSAGFETVARTIERDADSGLIGTDEGAVYAEIVALGRAERFQDAEHRCLKFLQEQARR
ncbi:MAG: hypothetical protein ACK6CT_03140 [Planctomycetia bacterium]|jgi:hypothetical protein